jgi:hypothetical protein
MIDAPVLVVDDAASAPRHRDGREQVVRDEHGNHVGTVRTGPESMVARSLRMLTTDSSPEITSIDVFDGAGARAFTLDRPARLLKPRIFVAWGDGSSAGEIVPQKLLSGLRYTIEVGGIAEALLEASDEGERPAWVIDRQGALLARVSTRWEVPSTSLHPIPNTHLVLRERVLPQPLGVVVLAALLALDGMLLGPL